ncbi:hypothetical protein HDU76_008799 [Blyttiomyces sp. JEL0837]|nr:hypothetical protein HDU76_008799 [Blyttiomyces sp. JEL0837]
MPVHADELESRLKTALEAEHVGVVDTSDGCGNNFEVVVVSKMFEGKTTLQKHRMVNDAAKDLIAQVHAFSQKTFTPQQWADQQQK